MIDIGLDKCETTQERLIKATQALIAVYGYDAMTTRMIANLANVTLSAINFHFGSKADLVKAAMEQAAAQLEKPTRNAENLVPADFIPLDAFETPN